MDPLTQVVVNKLVGKAADKLFSSLGATWVKNRGIQSWKDQVASGQMYGRMSQVRQVKTLLDWDVPSDVVKIYHPLKAEGEGGALHTLRSRLDLPDPSRTVISGVAGLGKSIALKYMAISEASSLSAIPVFIELYKLNGEFRLIPAIVRELEQYGLHCDGELFTSAARQGVFALYLDGFDELRWDLASTVVSDIEELASMGACLPIIVTTRPSTSILNSGKFRRVNIRELAAPDFRAIVHKLASDHAESARVIAEAESVEVVRRLMTTPLLVTLLLLHFRATSSIPDSVAAYFGDVFETLIHKHDSRKGTLRRHRRAGLGNRELRRLFGHVSFRSVKCGLREFDRNTFCEWVEKALQSVGITANPDDVTDDICEITNLVIPDGTAYRFIHKSIPEFYAAEYLASRPPESKRKFYERMLANIRHDWVQVLKFLSLIDEYGFTKWFALPDMLALFGTDSPHKVRPEDCDLDQLVKAAGSGLMVEYSYIFAKGFASRSGIEFVHDVRWCLEGGARTAQIDKWDLVTEIANVPKRISEAEFQSILPMAIGGGDEGAGDSEDQTAKSRDAYFAFNDLVGVGLIQPADGAQPVRERTKILQSAKECDALIERLEQDDALEDL